MSRFIVAGVALVFVAALHASAAERSFGARNPLAFAAMPVAAQAATDLATKVKARLDAEPELKNNTITVTASGTTVTLDGEAPSVLARAKAGELALNTDGVKKVNNKLKVAKAE
jgi:osmotically-inducible protein OsmY